LLQEKLELKKTPFAQRKKRRRRKIKWKGTK
jgi:hypothetical protein